MKYTREKTEALAKNMKKLLKENEMTQVQVANELEMPIKRVQAWFQGRTEPCIRDLIALADTFNVSVGQLVGTEEIESVNDGYTMKF